MSRNQRKAKRYSMIEKKREAFKKRNKEIWKEHIIKKRTLAAIGREYNLSRERIRQIVFQEKMRKIREGKWIQGKIKY